MFLQEKAHLSFSKIESFLADSDWNALLEGCYSTTKFGRFFAHCGAPSFELWLANSGLLLNGVYFIF